MRAEVDTRSAELRIYLVSTGAADEPVKERDLVAEVAAQALEIGHPVPAQQISIAGVETS